MMEPEVDLGLAELLEQLGLLSRSHPDARVRDHKLDPALTVPAHP